MTFVPEDFEIPTTLKTDRFHLLKLTTKDAEKDYEAIMTSIDHLQGVFGPFDPWPQPDLTLEQDIKDLYFHQKEFERRSSFAYTVMNLDESKCLGCVYIIPSVNPKYDAMAITWVRKDELKNGLDKYLFEAIKKWVQEKWLFRQVAYPKEIGWKEFETNYFLSH